MGNPSHYSQDLPNRCHRLTESLWPKVLDVFEEGKERLGPLTTTFLLAMATPMVVLPIERIQRHRGREIKGYVNDRPLDGALAQAIDQTIGANPFSECPFFDPGQWRFATIAFNHQNFAREFPDELRKSLNDASSLDAAASLDTQQWASCLRNSLSHGGVCYLDAEGRADHFAKTEMLAFVSAVYPKYPKEHPLAGRSDMDQAPIRLKVLRVSEAGFRIFLDRWIEWLNTAGLTTV